LGLFLLGMDKERKFVYRRNCEISHDIVFPADMTRVVASVEYNGASYNGFQKQKSTTNTIQTHVEHGLSQIAKENITLVCAGRTDAGVHASSQIVHFDTLAVRPNKAWIKGVNAFLPDTIRMRWAQNVDVSFHARFQARARTYRYIIYANSVAPAILDKQVTWVRHQLDVQAMSDACKFLVGRHDFSSFRASRCQASNATREIYDLSLRPCGQFIVMEVKANAFLLHMVRNIAGAIIEVGKGNYPSYWVGDLLHMCDRTQGPMTASPYGLYFVNVEYDDKYELPYLPKGPLILPE